MTDLPVRRAAGVVLFHRRAGELRFLLLRNALHRTWGVPKGHAEAGEEPLETARRETEEETGVTAFRLAAGFREEIAYEVRPPEGRARKVVTYFLGEVDTDEVRRSPEHDDAAWVPLAEARARVVHPDLVRVLERAAAAALA